MTRAFLLSLLVRQRLMLRDGFATRYPHPWLIWEPGAWTAPTDEKEETVPSSRSVSSMDRPRGRDALCFELGPSAALLTLGRAPGSSITINDATLSRDHALLQLRGAGWELQAIGQHLTQVGGRDLQEGQTRLLASGDDLLLGGIRLTYYDPPGMVARLVKEWE